MEQQVFTDSGEWDQLDTMQFAFYDATLVVDVGTYKAGQKFAIVNVYYDDNAKMEFYLNQKDTEPVLTCKMKLQLEIT